MRRDLARYRLRASRATLAGLPIVATLAYALFSQLATWRGDWLWGYNTISQALPVVLVLTAFVAGWDAGSRGSGYAALAERGPDGYWKVSWTLLLVPTAVAAGSFLATAAVMSAITVAGDGVVQARYLLLVASHLLMILVAASLGLYAGRYLNAPLAACMAAAVIALLMFMPSFGGQQLFGLAGANSPLVGLAPDWRYYAVNLSALAVIAASLIASVLVRHPTAWVAIAPLVVAVIVTGGLAVLGPRAQFTSTGTPASRCVDEPVPVCVYPGYDRLLPVASDRLAGFFATAAERGVPRDAFPERFAQYGGVRPAEPIGVLEPGRSALRDNAFASEDLALALSTPLWCSAMFAAEPPLGLLAHLDRVHNWVLWVDGGIPNGEWSAREPKLAAMTPPEQAAVIVNELDALERCDS